MRHIIEASDPGTSAMVTLCGSLLSRRQYAASRDEPPCVTCAKRAAGIKAEVVAMRKGAS